MAKLGKINFNDYDSESDTDSNFIKSSSTCKNVIRKKIQSNKSCLTKEKYNKVCCESSESESESDSSISHRSIHTINDCEIITYDNSNEKCNNQNDSECNNQNDSECNNQNDSESKFFKTDIFVSKPIDNKDINCNTTNYENSSSFFYDGYEVPKCEDNIKSCNNNLKSDCNKVEKKYINSRIFKFDKIDIVSNRLEKIVSSFKTMSHLLQYYINMLEQVKIEVSDSDMSHSVNSCIETTVSLASYLKADIDRNKTFVVDDKYCNKQGYNLTNGITKIYYVEKIKLSLLKNGELIFGIYEENNKLRQYDLGGNFADVSFEGDLYIMIDEAKEKAVHFNKFLQRKHMKIASIFNLHLIYLNKYKT